MAHPAEIEKPIELSVVGEMHAAYEMIKGLSTYVESLREKAGSNPQIGWALEGAVEKLRQAEGLMRNAVESIPPSVEDRVVEPQIQ